MVQDLEITAQGLVEEPYIPSLRPPSPCRAPPRRKAAAGAGLRGVNLGYITLSPTLDTLSPVGLRGTQLGSEREAYV